MLPELAAALDAPNVVANTLSLRGTASLSVQRLGMRMQDWTEQAGIAPGHTLHGLRKALGKMLAEAGATTRELMAILGHDDIRHAELYTREAEQRSLASEGMRKLALRRGEPTG